MERTPDGDSSSGALIFSKGRDTLGCERGHFLQSALKMTRSCALSQFWCSISTISCFVELAVWWCFPSVCGSYHSWVVFCPKPGLFLVLLTKSLLWVTSQQNISRKKKARFTCDVWNPFISVTAVGSLQITAHDSFHGFTVWSPAQWLACISALLFVFSLWEWMSQLIGRQMTP